MPTPHPRLIVLFVMSLTACFTGTAMADDTLSQQEQFLYIGTMVEGDEPGIYRFAFNRDSGSLRPLGSTGGLSRPGFLALAPNGERLYAVGRLGGKAKPNGAVAAFSIDRGTGELTRLGEPLPTGGDSACHVSVDATGRCVLVANYGGSVASFTVDPDGSLGERATHIEHEGSSVHPRQKGPHAHSINPDPANRFAIAADLGLDQLLIYRLDPDAGTLTPHAPPAADIHPGAGPRHFTFHPDGRHAYVVNELDSTVMLLDWDAEQGTLTPRQTVPTLPDDFDGDNTTAEVAVHPAGGFLYASNRGHDSLALFEIDPADGTLTPHGHVSTGGKTPRNFGIDPTGRFLIAANQQSDSLVVFHIDEQTGGLTVVGEPVSVPSPVCVRFLPL